MASAVSFNLESAINNLKSKILLYWFLLLLPTIALGVFGWRLLRQEELRLAETAQAAQVERAELVAENLTLFLEEARSGIIAGLSEMPVGDARESLRVWSEANPLVRQTFIWRPHAGLIPPVDSSAHTSFLRRYQQLLAPRSYWEEKVDAFQRAAPARSEQAANDSSALGFEYTPRQELKQLADEARMANIARQQQSFAASRSSAMTESHFSGAANSSADLREREPTKPLEEAPNVTSSGSTPFLDKMPVGSLSEVRERDAFKPLEEVPLVTSSGWIPFLNEKPLSAIAWVELQPGGEIRGAEVDLESVISRMLAVLPAEEEGGDVYHLLDQTGKSYTSISAELSPAAIRLGLGPLLPGWQVVTNSPTSDTAAGRGFFVLSSLLLGVLLTGILSGGSLLLYQAHRHQVDARQKSSFVSNVSHELKTPLTTIRMYAELIGEGRIRDEAKQRNYLDVIITESHRLTRLINNVLDFSRLEQARKDIQTQAVYLGATITPILDAQEIRLQQANIALARDFPDDDPLVLTDPDALEQAALNLIDNAIKYASSGGELTVQAKAEDNVVCIRFMDRGPGIDARQQRSLFKKFSRGDTSLTANQPGCGLGLNIARRLLRRAGADLTYTSRPGGGACFTITLPMAPDEDQKNQEQTISVS